MWLFALGALPGTAWAEDDFHRYFAAAVRLYNQGDSELALEQLQRAKARTFLVQQDVQVALYEGLIFLELGPQEKALAAFETGLLLDPEVKLPVLVAPKVRDEFEAVREKVRKKLARRKSPASEAPPQVAVAPQAEAAPIKPKLEPSAAPAPKPFEPQAEWAESSRTRVPAAPLVLGSVGVVAAAVGVVFRQQSHAKAREAGDAYVNGLPPQQDLARLAMLLNDAEGEARKANVMFGTAALAVGGAVVTWLLTGDDGSAESRGEP